MMVVMLLERLLLRNVSSVSDLDASTDWPIYHFDPFTIMDLDRILRSMKATTSTYDPCQP